jgi:glycine oxidase
MAVSQSESDAIVVGAGVVGLAAAWRLVRAGLHVTVYDPAPATGASRAAAGMLAAVSEYWFEEEPLLALSVPASQAYPEIAAALRTEGYEPAYRDNPTLVATADAADRDDLQRLQRAQQRQGLVVRTLSPAEARRRNPLLSPAISGAFLAEDDHQVTPRALAAAYLQSLEASPAARVVREPVAALRWDAAGERVIGVRTAAGEDVAAAWTVVANALWSPELGGLPDGLQLPIRPVYGDVLRLRTPEHLAPILNDTVRGLVHGRHVYVVPRTNGNVVIGATEREDDRPGVLAGGVLQLLRDAQELVPAVSELELWETIARPRPGTPDNLPLLGRGAPGLIFDTGTYRHGILLSAATALAVAALVTETAPPADLAPFDPWRFSK